MKSNYKLNKKFKWEVGAIVVFMICITGNVKAMAQEEGREYVPFVEEGKTWYCSYQSVKPITPEHPEGEGIDCIFTMRGDTLISGKEYKKVYCQFEEFYGDNEQHNYCAVREEDYCVFIIEDGMKEEKLLYDFSCPGEIITLTYSNQKFARTKGWHHYGFLPGQMMYSVCIFSGGEIDHSNAPGFWVDGVGSPISNPFAFEFSAHIFDQPKFGKYIYVRTCMKDGNYIFDIDWTAEPIDPSSIDEKNNTNNSPQESHYYDLQGRHLTEKPSQLGIYIQDGRKYVVK